MENLNILLEKAETLIVEEITKRGYIDDTDDSDRFLDNLAKKISEEVILQGNDDIDLYYEKEEELEKLQKELLYQIKDTIMTKYKIYGTCENGHYAAYYYNNDKTFSSWNKFDNYFNIGR